MVSSDSTWEEFLWCCRAVKCEMVMSSIWSDQKTAYDSLYDGHYSIVASADEFSLQTLASEMVSMVKSSG